MIQLVTNKVLQILNHAPCYSVCFGCYWLDHSLICWRSCRIDLYSWSFIHLLTCGYIMNNKVRGALLLRAWYHLLLLRPLGCPWWMGNTKIHPLTRQVNDPYRAFRPKPAFTEAWTYTYWNLANVWAEEQMTALPDAEMPKKHQHF